MANSSDDFSQVISEELTCPICLEELKEPKMLRCSHNICRECLERMPMFEKISCPVCRKPTRIPKGGVRCLPTNAAIVRVVEATLARKAKVEIQNSLSTGKSMVELLAKRISDFDKPLRVLHEIHEKADKLVEVIRKQEAKLCREVEEFYSIKCETINEDKSDLDKMLSDASKSVQEAETILKQTKPDSTKTINAAKALREQIEDITELGLDRDMSTLEEFEFKLNAHVNSILKEKFGKLTKKGSCSDSDLPLTSHLMRYSPSTPGISCDTRDIRRLKAASADWGQPSRPQISVRRNTNATNLLSELQTPKPQVYKTEKPKPPVCKPPKVAPKPPTYKKETPTGFMKRAAKLFENQ